MIHHATSEDVVVAVYLDYINGHTVAYVAARSGHEQQVVLSSFTEAGLPVDLDRRHADAAAHALKTETDPQLRAVPTLRVDTPEKTGAQLARLHSPPPTANTYWGRFYRALHNASVLHGGQRVERFSPALVAAICQDYLHGHTIAQVAARFRYCSPTVRKVLAEANIPLRTPRVPAGGPARAHTDSVHLQINAANRALERETDIRTRAVLALRIANPDKTSSQLAHMHSPPLTKAAYWGRLRRAVDKVS